MVNGNSLYQILYIIYLFIMQSENHNYFLYQGMEQS